MNNKKYTLEVFETGDILADEMSLEELIAEVEAHLEQDKQEGTYEYGFYGIFEEDEEGDKNLYARY